MERRKHKEGGENRSFLPRTTVTTTATRGSQKSRGDHLEYVLASDNLLIELCVMGRETGRGSWDARGRRSYSPPPPLDLCFLSRVCLIHTLYHRETTRFLGVACCRGVTPREETAC